MRTSRSLLVGSIVVGALTLTGCGVAPPGDNGVPPWQQLGLGDQVLLKTYTATVHGVDGNAADLELCYLNDQTGNASTGAWWVWTDQGGGFYPLEEQGREPVYGAEKDVDCHRGWIEFGSAPDAQITHVTFRPSKDLATEYTWQVDKPGA